MDAWEPTPDPELEPRDAGLEPAPQEMQPVPPDEAQIEPSFEREPTLATDMVGEKAAARFSLKAFLALLAAAVVASLAILPFSRTLIKQIQPPIVPEPLLPLVLAVSVVAEVFLSAVAIGLGLALGPAVDLGRMFVPAWSALGSSRARRFWVFAGEPLALGLVLGAIMSAFAWNVDPAAGANGGHNFVVPGPWEGFLASIGAGIREEIWLRLGFMTVLVALGAALWRALGRKRQPPPPFVVWLGNLLAAIAFAAIHIPQTKALLGLTTAIVLFVFFGNGLPGLVFGWLYWRRGLVAAMIAHFGLDIVLKVVVPLIS